MYRMLLTIFATQEWARTLTAQPVLFFTLLFVGIPLGILLTVSLTTAVFVLPIALLMGWL